MTRTAEIDRYLTEIPLLSACSKQELHTVSGLTTALTIPAGKVVTREGQLGREFVVILEGTASVSINGTVIATLGRGDFFGEIALLDGGPRTATVIAETDLLARVISYVDFSGMLEDVPSVARKLLIGVASRLREADVLLSC